MINMMKGPNACEQRNLVSEPYVVVLLDGNAISVSVQKFINIDFAC